MPTPTAERVPRDTAVTVQRRIDRRIAMQLDHHAMRPSEIDRRLDERDREWNVDRTLQANAATLARVGLALGAAVDRRWFLLPAAVASFLLQHALQGGCPPLPVLRRIGVRTAEEIAQERYALKALRGDFAKLPGAAGDRSGASGDPGSPAPAGPRSRARQSIAATRR